jgi:hypothetical protein
MNIQFLLFEDDGEEPNHSLTFDLPSVPQTGDRVTISRPGQEGCSNFIVRARQWGLAYPEQKTPHRAGEIIVGSTSAITVECVFEVGSYSSEEHK